MNENDGNRIHVIKTDLDLACGTRGRTVDVVLDTQEGPIPKRAKRKWGSKRLHIMYMLVELDNMRFEALSGLLKSIVPFMARSDRQERTTLDCQQDLAANKNGTSTYQLPIPENHTYTTGL